FEYEPEDRRDGLDQEAAIGQQIPEWAGPSTKEEQGGDTAYGDHVGVLGHEEHGEFHGAVFGVVTGGELGFRLGQVEGGAVGFGISCRKVYEEGDKLKTTKN